MKNKKGITLISLVITVIVILILASVGTYSGIQVIKLSKLTAFTTELKIMQTQVNAMYEKYTGTEEYGEPIPTSGSVKEQADKVFTELEKETQINRNGYRYWSNQTIKGLGIEGVEQDFFVNLEKRSIVSYQGIEYEGKIYYTLNQLPNGLYNVEYTEVDETKGEPTFDVKIETIDQDKWRISISNIQYTGYINKWQIRYKLEEETTWKETENLSFIVSQQGTYKIKIGNNEIESQEKQIKAIENYTKEGLILHYDAINNIGEGDYKHSTTTTTWKDLSGNGNDGILNGFEQTEESGWKEKGLKFDGIDDIVKTNEKFDFSTFQAGVPFSYGATFTVKEVSKSWYGIMTNMTRWGEGGFNIQYGSAQKIAIGMGVYLNSTTDPMSNTTYNIYGVYDGSVVKLYVNGKLENSTTYDIKAGSKAFTIGYFYDELFYPTDGEILNVKIYNKVLTEEEITKNFNIDKLRFGIPE